MSDKKMKEGEAVCDDIFKHVRQTIQCKDQLPTTELDKIWDSRLIDLPEPCASFQETYYSSKSFLTNIGYAIAYLKACMMAEYNTRLIVCLNELNLPLLIVETIIDQDILYFDYRRQSVSTKQGLIGSTFYSFSPWNPVEGDKRAWGRF